ncbi:MAG: flagellar type III secretion system pore protein FliP [Planctomycetota bacterium]
MIRLLPAFLFAAVLLCPQVYCAAQVRFEPVTESASPSTPSKDLGVDRLLDQVVQDFQNPSTAASSSDGLLGASFGEISSGESQADFLRQHLSGSLQAVLMVSVLSLAPAILLMTTCYVRVVVVMGLLRQALGTGQLPPNQVVTSIAIFITLFVMAPVWNRVYEDSIRPYTAENSEMSAQEAWQAGVAPIREFMFQQILSAGNQDDVHLFYGYYAGGGQAVQYQEDVPLQVLLPAFMLSELKTAFLMGFMIFMPFLIIDLVVASVTISMGMMMLPPTMISLPFKLLLFVLVDGWELVVMMLLRSFGTMG